MSSSRLEDHFELIGNGPPEALIDVFAVEAELLLRDPEGDLDHLVGQWLDAHPAQRLVDDVTQVVLACQLLGLSGDLRLQGDHLGGVHRLDAQRLAGLRAAHQVTGVRVDDLLRPGDRHPHHYRSDPAGHAGYGAQPAPVLAQVARRIGRDHDLAVWSHVSNSHSPSPFYLPPRWCTSMSSSSAIRPAQTRHTLNISWLFNLAISSSACCRGPIHMSRPHGGFSHRIFW